MGIDIPALRAAVDLVAVVGSRVQLTKRGHEFVGLCPFHDEATSSFYTIPDKGFWHCFGCGANGDAIDFIREMDGLSFQDACKALGATDWQALPMKEGLGKRPAPRLPWASQKPPATDIEPASFATRALGEPVTVWTYRDLQGEVLGYVCRYEVDNNGEKKKVILQWTYGKEGVHSEGDPSWQCKHFSRPRPLYGLSLLHGERADAQVIIVEGEKTADAAAQLYPSAVVVTWPGGTNAAEHADWSPLYGRRCILIPDHDEPGQKACQYIAALLSSNNCAVKIVTPETSRPKGWDLADAVLDHWTPSIAMEWAKMHCTTYDPAAPVTAPPSNGTPPEQVASPVKKTRPRGKLKDADTLPPSAEDEEPVPPAFSDDALASRVVKLHGLDWRYVAAWGKWYRWDERYWQEDSKMAIFALIRSVCRQVVNFEQGALLNESAKRAITSSRSHAAVVRVTSYDAGIAATIDQWDKDPWVMSTPAGVIDLKTGEVRHPRREDYQSQIAAVSPSGECPRWLTFLKEVTGDNQELEDYLQRLAGYLLTGVTTEQMMAFFYGTGANGKGVFLRTIRSIMGDYACVASIETFTETKGDRHETELAMLRGARFVTAQETDDGRKWAESRIKALTGGDPIRARFMRQDYFEFQPAFKLIFAGNHKPGLRSVDEAMRRRVHIVPWTITIEKDKRDPLLDDKLKAEHAGILQWMIVGCLAWQQHGLNAPQCVMDATEEYLEAEDALQGWLEECCVVEPLKETPSGELYRSYVTYCEQTREHAWSQKRLIQNLQARGMERTKTCGLRMLKGIRLKQVTETGQMREW